MLDRFERYLLCFGVFLAPLSTLRPTDIAVTYSDLAFAFLGITMIVRRRTSLAPMQDATIIWVFAILCLIGGLFISSIVNGSAVRAIVVCTQYFFAYAFLPFILFSEDEDLALLIVKICVYSCFFLAICGFIFVATGYDGDQRYITGAGRLSSFSGNPNGLAGQIALTMPLLLYLWFSGLLPAIACLCIFASFIAALIMTSSNGGLASTALGIGIFLLFTGNLRWLIKGAILVILAIVVVLTVGRDYLPEVFERRVMQTFESGSLDQAGTYEGRMALNIEATEWLDDSLFLGIGADQYRERSKYGEPVHNQYLIVWIEGGTIALIGWLLILGTMCITGVRGYQLPNGMPAAAAVLSVTMILAIVAITNPHIYARSYVVPVLAAMGLALAARAGRHAPKPEYQPGGDRMAQSPPEPGSDGRRPFAHRPAMQAQIRYKQRP